MHHRFHAMGSTITVTLDEPNEHADEAVKEVEETFTRIQAACTRFDRSSELMRLNETGSGVVGPECAQIIAEAWSAYNATAGVFDPRVLATLSSLGYETPSPTQPHGPVAACPATQWRVSTHPTEQGRRLEPGPHEVGPHRIDVGPHPIDLGGIGKGWAAHAAMAHARKGGTAALINAGGDCVSYSSSAKTWTAGVEDSFSDGIVAACNITNTSIATSSKKVKNWKHGNEQAHHLIDPRTSAPAHTGIYSVTVIANHTAWAEVWAKTALIAGVEYAVERAGNLAMLWQLDTGEVAYTPEAEPHLTWVRA